MAAEVSFKDYSGKQPRTPKKRKIDYENILPTS